MYDVIVVGGGHAGIEACLAPARIGMKTLLITSHFENVGYVLLPKASKRRDFIKKIYFSLVKR